jgi:alkylhydroperoxidase family enzyme
MALVPYLSESDLDEVDRPLLASPYNLYRALAHSPGALRHFAMFGQWVQRASAVDPRLRELAILQVGYLTATPYQWSHHIQLGRAAGVSDNDIDDLIAATAGKEHGLGALDTQILRAAREITTDARMSEETWHHLLGHLGRARLVELTLIMCHVTAVSRILNTLRIDVEPEYQSFLEEFPLAEPSSGKPQSDRPSPGPIRRGERA